MTQVSQVHVDAAIRTIVRFEDLIDQMQRATSRALIECDVAVARLTKRETVKCSKCHIEVDPARITMPNRCMDQSCPLKKDEGQ